MKHVRNSVIIVVLGMLSAQAGLSRLDAISMLETGNNDLAIGRDGEVSRFQILPTVWRNYTRTWNYRDPATARWVAWTHLNSLEEDFRRRAGREPTDFDRYVMWNAGINYYGRVGFSPWRVQRIVRDRANRYVNLRNMEQDVPVSLQ